MKKDLLFIVGASLLLGLYSCTSQVSQPTVSMENQPHVTQSPQNGKSDVPRADDGESTIFPREKNENVKQIPFECETYFSTEWGDEGLDFGYFEDAETRRISGPYPPVFDDNGVMYLADPANNRILRFSNKVSPGIIPIPRSYILDYGSQKVPWSNLSVSANRIFLRYSAWDGKVVDRLAVLSLTGKEEAVIDLDLFYPLRSILATPILADGKGGVLFLLDPTGLIHFDRDLNSEFVDLGASWPYTDMIIGWDKSIYTYSNTEDTLLSWGESPQSLLRHTQPNKMIQNVLSRVEPEKSWGKLIGVDKTGRVSMIVTDSQENKWLIRFSAGSEEKRINQASIPKEIPNSFRLAPDGSLFVLSYNDISTGENPRIIRCSLKEN